MSGSFDPHALIERHLRGELSQSEMERLAKMLDTDASARRDFVEQVQWDTQLAEVLREGGDRRDAPAEPNAPGAIDARPEPQAVTKRERTRTKTFTQAILAMAAAIIVTLTASQYFQGPRVPRPIAQITGLSGSLQWTGDGGRVVRDLEAGSVLHGGTLESLSADSWAVLTFRDRSTVTLSGRSTLTISEGQQKELHLREGSVSAHIAPQRDGPMLIHTPTAKLEVLGTRLDIEAGMSSTALRVNEGRVRVTRLVDGSVVEVEGDHQVVASASRLTEFKVTRRPVSVTSWQSSLPSGAGYGEWVPEAGGGGGLRTAPMLLNYQKEPVTLHVASLSICRGPTPPVVLTSGGKFRIRGQIETSGDIYFGLTTKHIKGGFAGKYVAARRFELSQQADERLEMELHVEQFKPQEEEFADSPIGLELVDWWCFTYNVDAGLSVASVELLPSTTSPVPQPPTTQPPQLPILDLWTAASQGNLEAVRRYLAAGAEIDATFVAPGIPTSGATPLHLAVLADQCEMVDFLVEKGANVNARQKNEDGGTPLHWAAFLGRIEVARRLIEAGADVNAEDNRERTPLDVANHDRKAGKEAKGKLAEFLRENGGQSTKGRAASCRSWATEAPRFPRFGEILFQPKIASNWSATPTIAVCAISIRPATIWKASLSLARP